MNNVVFLDLKKAVVSVTSHFVNIRFLSQVSLVKVWLAASLLVYLRPE